MTTEPFIRTWQVGTRTCRLTLPADAAGLVQIDIEWTPDVPKRLSDIEQTQYVKGRNEALAEWAHLIGRVTAVVDL